MTKKAEGARQVRVFYVKSEHYMLLPATGVFGGVTPIGDILVEFFVDRQTPPESIVLEIDPPKASEIEKVGERFIRELQVSFLLRADRAHSIGKWLIEKAAQAGYTEIKD